MSVRLHAWRRRFFALGATHLPFTRRPFAVWMKARRTVAGLVELERERGPDGRAMRARARERRELLPSRQVLCDWVAPVITGACEAGGAAGANVAVTVLSASIVTRASAGPAAASARPAGERRSRGGGRGQRDPAAVVDQRAACRAARDAGRRGAHRPRAGARLHDAQLERVAERAEHQQVPPNVDPPTTILRSGCSASELAAAPAPAVTAVAPPVPKPVESSPPFWVSRQSDRFVRARAELPFARGEDLAVGLELHRRCARVVAGPAERGGARVDEGRVEGPVGHVAGAAVGRQPPDDRVVAERPARGVSRRARSCRRAGPRAAFAMSLPPASTSACPSTSNVGSRAC